MTRKRVTAGSILLLYVLGTGILAPQAGDTVWVRGLLDAAGGTARSPKAVLRIGSLGQPFSGVVMSSVGYRVSPGVALQQTPQKPILEGDFNSDRTVDFSDFVIFAGGFGKQRGQAGFNARLDLDGDGTVAFGDFVRFAEAFGNRG